MNELDSASWDERTGELDAYYRRPYVESAALLDGGRPFLLEHEGALLAGIEREKPARDVVTPYGYGGPVGGDGSFWAAYEEWARIGGHRNLAIERIAIHGRLTGARVFLDPLPRAVADEHVAGEGSLRFECFLFG